MIESSVKRANWIFGVFAPIILAVLIAGSFSYLIFSGPTHGNLAGKADNYILEKMLIYQGSYKVSSATPIVTIDITDQDLASMRSNRQNGIGDINIEEYADILRMIRRHQPQSVILHWLPMAHEGVDGRVDDYFPLVHELERFGSPETVIIGYPVTGEFSLPDELKKNSLALDDEICSMALQACPYVAAWDDWVVQVMLNKINKKMGSQPPALALTTSFSTTYPNFILNLPDPSTLPSLKVSEVGRHPELIKDRIVFIGRDIPKVSQPKLWKGFSLMGAQTVFNLKDPEQFGQQTPLHTFWAQIAAMRLQHEMISVLPTHLIIAITMVLSLLLVIVIVLLGANIGLSLFLFSIVMILGIDLVSLRFLNFYIPPFLILYSGFLTFVTAGFLRISYEIYYRSRISERKKAIDFAADLKGNFISLVSHNLNTPVAKLQGMVDLLKEYSHGSQAEKDIDRCIEQTSQLSLAVQLILATVRLRDAGVQNETVRLRSLLEEFNSKYGQSLLRKLGLPTQACVSEGHDEDADLPVKCDAKGLILFLASLVVAHRLPVDANEIFCDLNTDHDQILLNVQINRNRNGSQSEADFYHEICVSYAKLFMLSYLGRCTHDEASGQVCYQLLLP